MCASGPGNTNFSTFCLLNKLEKVVISKIFYHPFWNMTINKHFSANLCQKLAFSIIFVVVEIEEKTSNKNAEANNVPNWK